MTRFSRTVSMVRDLSRLFLNLVSTAIITKPSHRSLSLRVLTPMYWISLFSISSWNGFEMTLECPSSKAWNAYVGSAGSSLRLIWSNGEFVTITFPCWSNTYMYVTWRSSANRLMSSLVSFSFPIEVTTVPAILLWAV